jgi:glycosyltransferase involved in cell wall biosynthesis
METGTRPRVSIGLPVYNGENFLAAAIESILAQTFTDFELIVCDDGSTDRTGVICRPYAARDRRIRYHRNERNLGAAPNFNRCFELARGEYFRWAAHDDLLAPDLLERCVAALEADPDAVLCHSLVRVIDEEGRTVTEFGSPLQPGVGAPRASERFAAAALTHHLATEVFAVMRRDVLATTRLYGGYPRTDTALIAELALCGRFIELPAPLFLNRDHPDRYMRALAADVGGSLAWYDTAMANRRALPSWRLYRELFRMVGRHVAEPGERLRCYGHLLRWPWVNWNLVRLMVDLVCLVEPRALGYAQRVKRRLFGSVLFIFARERDAGKTGARPHRRGEGDGGSHREGTPI